MFPSSFVAVALGLFALSSSTGVAAASGSHSSLNAASHAFSKRATTFVDPSVSVDFSSTVPGECKVGPCTDMLAMDKSCNADRDCTNKLLCTTAGLNSLVKCNTCVLALANRTTGVSDSLYANVTSILTTTSTSCSAKPDTSLRPFSDYTHTAPTASTATNTSSTPELSGDGVTSEGVGAAGTTDAKSAGVATLQSGSAWAVALVGAVAVLVL